MGMGIDQWECEGMGILIVFPHTFSAVLPRPTQNPRKIFLHCYSNWCHVIAHSVLKRLSVLSGELQFCWYIKLHLFLLTITFSLFF